MSSNQKSSICGSAGQTTSKTEEIKRISERMQKFPDMKDTCFLLFDTRLYQYGNVLFESFELSSEWEYKFEDDEISHMFKNRIEFKKHNPRNLKEKFVITNDATIKYLNALSPTVIPYLQNAYFCTNDDTLDYEIDDDRSGLVKCAYSSFWLGEFFRSLSEDDIRNSVMLVNPSRSVSLFINSTDMFLYRNHTIDEEGCPLADPVHISKKLIDFSTYENFIKSLNFETKKARVSKIRPSDDNDYVYEEISVRRIVHSSMFKHIEYAYEEIIERGFDK